MPSLAELSDTPPQAIDQPYRGVNLGPLQGLTDGPIGNTAAIVDNAATPQVVQALPAPMPDVGSGVLEQPFSAGTSVGNKLFGTGAEERYQTWPEKLIREALSAPHDVMNTTEPVTSEDLIAPAQAISALAGTGGVAGTDAALGEAALGSSPFLRPALKYEGKIYKAPVGGQHLDALPDHLADTFQKQALSGEDISNFNFGFMNHKGQFLDREKALEYGINEGLIDPSAGQYGALTSTLLADSSKPGTAIEAMAKTGQPFYSALEHNVNNIGQSKMTGDQWLGTLANKPGVKPEELQWTGVQDFLKERGNQPVTKQELREHLQNNKVELKEVNKGTGELKAATKDLYKEAGDNTVVNGYKMYPDEIGRGLFDGSITPKDLPTNLQPYAEKLLSLRDQHESPTKYHGYQLPGGENYREMLMTLPDKARATAEARGNAILDRREKIQDEFDTLHGKDDLDVIKKRKILTGEFNDLTDELRNLNLQDYANGKGAYKSSHWDEPNILAHVRMNDRNIDGKKSLHLEEIQSDWHQQGRDKGYAKPVDPELIKSANEIANRVNNSGADRISKHKADQLLDNDKITEKEWNTLVDYGNKTFNSHKAIPDAPFKKSWHELALKRMIREAAEKGYDRLSWTPGEAQAARYDLSKSVDSLFYKPEDSYLKGFKDGKPIVHQHATPDELPNIVGKEAAKKLLETKPAIHKIYERHDSSNQPSMVHSLEGEQLKIGGEGMKGFYDQIIPKALEKLSGEKVKQSIDPNAGEKFAYINKKSGNKGQEFKSQEEAKAWLKESGIDPENVTLLQVNRRAKEGSKFEPVHYIDIPQSLKDKAMHKGFPLFSSTHMFTPVAGNPFEDKSK